MDGHTPMDLPQEGHEALNCQVWFLKEMDVYETEKPYRLRFASPDASIARTNIENEEASVRIHDLRSYPESLTYERNGFTIMEMHSALTAENSNDDQKVKELYLDYLTPVLCGFFGTPNVVVLEYLIRRRDKSFPISHGGDYEHNQPVLVAHVDWTPQHVVSRVKKFMGAEHAENILGGHYQYVHVWKPLKGPNKDWPLALCDLTTVDPDKDLEMADTVFESEVQENYQMYHRQNHRWFYLREQRTSELMVFRQYDSNLGHGSGVPHVSFADRKPDTNSEPRESIEVQCLVYWNEA